MTRFFSPHVVGTALVAVTLVESANAQVPRSQLPQIASVLVPGMQLVYASDGVESPPWMIDSVVTFADGGRSCARIRVRTSPAQPLPEARAHCADSSTMFNRDERAGQWRSARPLHPGMLMEMRQANGVLVAYEAAEPVVERISVESIASGQTVVTDIEVIPTTVTTRDSTGKVVRRLRERFSVALATATGGVFEVPDSTQATGWTTTRRFELVRIRTPR
jgi:hypothetical protein